LRSHVSCDFYTHSYDHFQDETFLWLDSSGRPGPPPFRGFEIILRHTTFGRTPLDEWSARRKGLYLTTHDIHQGQSLMPQARFEPATPASEVPQTYVSEYAATGIGLQIFPCLP
jgi:hypothetical protein